MSDVSETFFTAVGCMDGRVQDPVAEFGRARFEAKFADTITEAGLVGQLAKGDPSLLESIKYKVADVSIGKHHSKGILVHGHQECAGNPVDDETHRSDIKKSVDLVKQMAGDSLPVVGLFIKRSASDPKIWEAEEVI